MVTFSYIQTMQFSTLVCPQIDGSRGHKHGYIMLIFLCFGLCCYSLIVDVTGNLDEIISLL